MQSVNKEKSRFEKYAEKFGGYCILPADLTLLFLHEDELSISKQHKAYHDR